jgi:uncharacterized protein YodC (DUF2158 family)
MPNTDDSTTVTCKWFAKDAVKIDSFPAKALEHKSTDPREMSDEELQDIINKKGNQHTEQTGFTVGDIVFLKSGGPPMTIVNIKKLDAESIGAEPNEREKRG